MGDRPVSRQPMMALPSQGVRYSQPYGHRPGNDPGVPAGRYDIPQSHPARMHGEISAPSIVTPTVCTAPEDGPFYARQDRVEHVEIQPSAGPLYFPSRRPPAFANQSLPPSSQQLPPGSGQEDPDSEEADAVEKIRRRQIMGFQPAVPSAPDQIEAPCLHGAGRLSGPLSVPPPASMVVSSRIIDTHLPGDGASRTQSERIEDEIPIPPGPVPPMTGPSRAAPSSSSPAACNSESPDGEADNSRADDRTPVNPPPYTPLPMTGHSLTEQVPWEEEEPGDT